MTLLKVERLFAGTWGDAEWSENGKPMRFANITSAQSEIENHVKDCKIAARKGQLKSAPKISEFRIVPA